MVKFSAGFWENAPDVAISWATEIVKSEAFEDRVRCVAATKPIQSRGDMMNTPTITLECSSPAPDVVLLEACHWKGHQPTLQGPHFELLPAPDSRSSPSSKHACPWEVTTLKSKAELRLASGTLSAAFDTRPGQFKIDFRSQRAAADDGDDHHLLTQLLLRSVGYVKRNTSLVHPNLNLVDPDKGERWMTMQFESVVGEKYYGLGERFGPFVKNGQAVDMWNEASGTSSELAYKNVPFFISSRGYGVFVACPGLVSFEIQSENASRVNISVPLESIPVYVVHGPTPAAILQRYTELTGRPALPPPWTFDLWLSTSFTTDYDESTVMAFLEGMQERDIPVGVFHFDCFWMKPFQWCDFEFDEEWFPDPKGQLARLREKGYKTCVWINPYIAQESKSYEEGSKGGFFIKKHDGSIWQFDYWQPGMAFVDFTNPAACSWYQAKLTALMDLGVDCFKTDFGERIPTGNAVYFDGSNPAKMHNYYAFLYNKVTFEAVERYKGKNQAVVFARAATAGCQRFPVHWGGDPMSTFAGMAESLRGGLSLGLGGFGFWTSDIGGFMHGLGAGAGAFDGAIDPALYKRWIAFGALSSHSRLHGSGSYRVPWLVDRTGEADLVLKKFIDLKLELMPYIYASAIETHTTGVPMMRPLFVEFPDDPACWYLDTQYLLGPDLMVCPIFNAGGKVQFYVPEGKWYGIIDGKTRTGPGYFTETHDFHSLPLLLRPGRALVMGGRSEYGAQFGRRLATYDWTRGATVLANPGAAYMDMEVVVPDSERPGEEAAVLRVYGSQSEIEVDVVKGVMADGFTIRVVVGDGSVLKIIPT